MKRRSIAVLLAAVLIGASLGCRPAVSTGTSPTSSKPDKGPGDKGEPLKVPPADPG